MITRRPQKPECPRTYAPRTTDIEDVSLLDRRTYSLHTSALRDFASWLHDQSFSSSVECLSSLPELLDTSLRAYGVHLYRSDQPLYRFVMAVTGAQRRVARLKRRLEFSWDFDRRVVPA